MERSVPYDIGEIPQQHLPAAGVSPANARVPVDLLTLYGIQHMPFRAGTRIRSRHHPEPVRISDLLCKGSTPVKTSATCMRTVRLREGIDTAGSVAILRPVVGSVVYRRNTRLSNFNNGFQ